MQILYDSACATHTGELTPSLLRSHRWDRGASATESSRMCGPTVLADRACATVVDVWIGTTEIRPTLTTARRRAPARQPGTAPMSTV